MADKTFNNTLTGPFLLPSQFTPLPVFSNIFYEDIDISEPLPLNESPPDLVKATYKNDLDILKIHKAIRALFGYKKHNLLLYKKEIETHKITIKVQYLSSIESMKLNEKISELEAQINQIENGIEWGNYIRQAEPILREYIPLSSDEVRGVIVFSGKKNLSEENLERVEQRLNLIDKYLKIAEKYIRLDIIHEINMDVKCPGCGNDSRQTYVEEDSGMVTCICGYQQFTLTKNSTYKDSSRVNINGRSTYEDRTTFIKAIERLMGLKINRIPNNLYKMLDDYFIKESFPIGEQVKQMYPLLENGQRDKTSINLMITALAATKNSSYYDCVHYIATNYWGWNLPNLSLLQEDIINDYDITQKVYDEIRERDSSLNVQIRLYLHLRARDYPCELTDFKTLHSRDSLEYHNKMWKIMCERTGVKFTPLI